MHENIYQKLAEHLTLNREEARIIANRAALPYVEAEKRLAEIALS